MTRFPGIRLNGDKEEAANWVRRGRTELQRLKDLRANMGVSTTSRTVEFNDYVTCTVSLHEGVEVIDITAIPPEGVKEEEAEEEEREFPEFCPPSFITYRDFGGFKYEVPPEGGAPVLTQQADYGHLLNHNGRSWVGIDNETDKFRGANICWYGVKDNMDKYVHKGLYSRCNLISWFGQAWGSTSEMSDNWESGFYFQGERWNAPSRVLAVCLLPHPQSTLNNDYFYVLGCSTPLWSTNCWFTKDIYIHRCKVTDNPIGPGWEEVAHWQTLDWVANFPDARYKFAISNDTYFPVTAYSAYIDKDGKATASFPVLRDTGFDDEIDPHPDGSTTTNGVGHGDGITYSSPRPLNFFSDTDWYGGHEFMPHTVKIDLVRGRIDSVVNETKLSKLKHTYSESNDSQNYPILGVATPTHPYADGHNYCSNENESDIYNADKPDNQKHKLWDKQNHQDRGDPTGNRRWNEYVSGGEEKSVIVGGMDALYSFHIRTEAVRREYNLEGTTSKQKWSVSTYDGPPGWDAVPMWSWDTQHYASADPEKVEFIVKRDDAEHFKMDLHKVTYQTEGGGQGITFHSSSAWWAHSIVPWKNTYHSDDPVSSTKYNRASIQSTFTNRQIMFYHPMINKALFVVRDGQSYNSGSNGFQSAQLTLCWGTQEDHEVLGSWTTSGTTFAHFYFDSANGFDHYNFGDHDNIAHCNGESGPGATKFVTHRQYNNNLCNWALGEMCGRGRGFNTNNCGVIDGVSFSPFWDNSTGAPGSTYGNIPGMPEHTLDRYTISGNPLTYERICVAVHSKNPDVCSHGDYPYILYIPKISISETPGNQNNVNYGFLQGTDGEYLWNDVFDEDNPDGWFFSNCLTLEQIKKLTKRTSDYPVDFGVI